MKFSFNWLCDLVDSLDVSPGEIGRLITMKTAECEGVERHGELLAQARIARVLTAEKIEGTHLTLTSVDTGDAQPRQVICGAPNCRAGLLTVHANIGKKTVRGVESDGMLASAKELGISAESAGILELESGTPGQNLPKLTPDTIVEIDNKSLTHRPDLWGHFGMAREVAAITGCPLKDPVNLHLIPNAPPPVKIAIADFALSPRYSALAFENVTVGPSPAWLQFRLEAVGLNPINNIVDVTNFVMAELGQPMHAFDWDKLQGDTIFIRPAAANESCEALDGITYSLDPANVVIADQSGPIAIAGIIGGGPSAITESTTRLLLESANFHATSVRKTSSKLKLRTDASMRFEKAQDPVNTVRGLARAIELLQIVSPGIRLVGGLADSFQPPAPPAPIHFTHDWMQKKLGRHISESEVAQILTSLAFGVEHHDGRFTVQVPSWRATKDISIADDLVEEVGRIIGYSSITPTPPLTPAAVPPREPFRAFDRRLRATLSAQGFTEVYNYSFVNERQANAFGLPLEDHIKVLNPIAAGQELLRTSLLPNIFENIEHNRREFASFRLFEVGKEIHKRQGALPQELPHAAIVLYEKEGDGQAGLLELKRIAQLLAPGAQARPAKARIYEHPHRAADMLYQGEPIGRLFEFHPNKVETGRAQVLYLNLKKLEELTPQLARYTPLRRFPGSSFDITVAADPKALVADLMARVFAEQIPNLLHAEYLYEYLDKTKSVKSVTFRFTVGATDRTLTSEEIHAAQDQVRAALS